MNKKALIENLINEGYLETPIIIEAFKKIDRADFVPEDKIDLAYTNQALPIEKGQTISQPLTVAFMLEKLEPQTGEKVLDIGTGSGWQAALLAYIISKNDEQNEGKVITIERIKSLKETAEKNLEKYSFLQNGAIKTVLGDGRKGYSEEAPYDKIIAAAAGNKIPESWKEQLKLRGRIVAPTGNSIQCLEKTSKEDFLKENYFGFSFVPLVKGSEKDQEDASFR